MTRSSNEFNVGPKVQSASTYIDAFRASEDSALVTCDGHGRWYEQGSRGVIYNVVSASATIAAGNVAPPAAAAATVLTILNPVGSGVNLEILQGWVTLSSATAPPVGAWAWCGATPGTLITAAEANTSKRVNRIGQAVVRVKAWAATTLTGCPAHSIARVFPVTHFAGAAEDATTYNVVMVDNVDGALVVPPGSVITLAPASQGTAAVAIAAIQYAEVPLPTGPDGSPIG